jgi:hypothetical protein
MATSLGVSQLDQEFIVLEYKPTGNEVSAEAEESPMLEAITRKRLVESVAD